MQDKRHSSQASQPNAAWWRWRLIRTLVRSSWSSWLKLIGSLLGWMLGSSAIIQPKGDSWHDSKQCPIFRIYNEWSTLTGNSNEADVRASYNGQKNNISYEHVNVSSSDKNHPTSGTDPLNLSHLVGSSLINFDTSIT